MAPVTRRRAARMRWDQLWLPPEVLENIIHEALQTVIHDALILASSFGIRRTKPSLFHLRSTPIKRRNGTGITGVDLRQELDNALRFRSILNISHVGQQYRSILARLLTRLLPDALKLAELTSRLSYLAWEILSRKRPKTSHTETPILNAIVSLKVIAACCMDVNIRGLRKCSAAEELFNTFTAVEVIGKSPIATSYLLYARLRIEVYQRLQSAKGSDLWACRTYQISRGSTEWINKPLLRKVTEEIFFLGYLLYAVAAMIEIHRILKFCSIKLEVAKLKEESLTAFNDGGKLSSMISTLKSIARIPEHLSGQFALRLKDHIKLACPEFEEADLKRLLDYTNVEATMVNNYLIAAKAKEGESKPASGAKNLQDLLTMKSNAQDKWFRLE